MVYVHVQTYGYAQYFGPKPQLVHCPTCNQNTKTKLKYITGYNNWLWCFIMGMLGLILCMYSIFFIINSIQRGSGLAVSSICLVVSLSICGCLLPIPFYCDNCKNVEHYCSVCDTYIGKYVQDSRRPIVILPPESYKNLPIKQ
uniref:LITAF domain-containing protein n=1 Tax=Meloidogyne javanica TaxID=6303 RepID=A0A915MWX0_MELJA